MNLMRNPAQRWITVCTIALMLAMGSGLATDKAAASTSSMNANRASPNEDSFLVSLGAQDDEEVRDALKEGHSLADIAAGAGTDVRSVIELQIKQLTEQLKERLRSGSITWEQFLAYRAEIPSLIESSAYEAHEPAMAR
ncbi:hypothetical protein [Cohnella sp. AR92]|uniref:hypothetical protein n=1 Tax=Cohnella sp. AR92 TaxID=648716 RepID=UPI000F8E92BF|nr:hypothetical protein [Cohnella sp. AR92]RUS42874.1 hypothetical protein ELR57_26070 [Cohnella sp. AR92]